jgi:hypothetical protein
VATKFGNRAGPGPNDEGGSRKHVIEAREASVRRLGTDRALLRAPLAARRPDRGNARGAGPAHPRREGSLRNTVQLRSLGVGAGAGGVSRAPAGSDRRNPTALQPALPTPRERPPAPGRRERDGGRALQPARRRDAYRQVLPRIVDPG